MNMMCCDTAAQKVATAESSTNRIESK